LEGLDADQCSRCADIHEHAAAAEPGGEPVADAARVAGNVIAAIADENPARHERTIPRNAPRHFYSRMIIFGEAGRA